MMQSCSMLPRRGCEYSFRDSISFMQEIGMVSCVSGRLWEVVDGNFVCDDGRPLTVEEVRGEWKGRE